MNYWLNIFIPPPPPPTPPASLSSSLLLWLLWTLQCWLDPADTDSAHQIFSLPSKQKYSIGNRSGEKLCSIVQFSGKYYLKQKCNSVNDVLAIQTLMYFSGLLVVIVIYPILNFKCHFSKPFLIFIRFSASCKSSDDHQKAFNIKPRLFMQSKY